MTNPWMNDFPMIVAELFWMGKGFQSGRSFKMKSSGQHLNAAIKWPSCNVTPKRQSYNSPQSPASLTPAIWSRTVNKTVVHSRYRLGLGHRRRWRSNRRVAKRNHFIWIHYNSFTLRLPQRMQIRKCWFDATNNRLSWTCFRLLSRNLNEMIVFHLANESIDGPRLRVACSAKDDI